MPGLCSARGHSVAIDDEAIQKAFECYCRWVSNAPARIFLDEAPQNSLLLALYDSMDKPSVPKLWELISELNRRSPKQQIGPRGRQQSLAAFERHMSRLLKRRKKGVDI